MNHIAVAEGFARVLDDKFKIVGLRFGLDPLLSLLPFGGSVIGLLLASYTLWIAHKEGAPVELRRKMAFNIAGDFIIGALPFVGWIGDVFVRANVKNIRLLKQYLKNRPIEGQLVTSS